MFRITVVVDPTQWGETGRFDESLSRQVGTIHVGKVITLSVEVRGLLEVAHERRDPKTASPMLAPVLSGSALHEFNGLVEKVFFVGDRRRSGVKRRGDTGKGFRSVRLDCGVPILMGNENGVLDRVNPRKGQAIRGVGLLTGLVASTDRRTAPFRAKVISIQESRPLHLSEIPETFRLLELEIDDAQ